MTDDWEPNAPDLDGQFAERAAEPGGVARLREYTDDQLERWREQLRQQRDVPEVTSELTIGGDVEKRTHQNTARNREQLIRDIDTELLHRLMAERDRNQENDRDR